MTNRNLEKNFFRDRRNYGIRGLLLDWKLPGRLTRAEKFDQIVVRLAMQIAQQCGKKAEGIEIAVEDVPPSDPAPWETGTVALSRSFPADRAAGLPARIVIYRRPIERRAERLSLAPLIQEVIITEMSQLLHCDPDEFYS